MVSSHLHTHVHLLFSLALGLCHQTSNTSFTCVCPEGRTGVHCETLINYCPNVTCQNQGVCRSLFLNYTCACLTSSFSGRHCEIIADQTRTYDILAKSFVSAAIAAIAIVVTFVLVMDVMKYVFGIDVTAVESQEVQSKRKPKTKKIKSHLILRYIYVPGPQSSSTSPSLDAGETTV